VREADPLIRLATTRMARKPTSQGSEKVITIATDAPRWQRDLIAQRAGVSKAHVDTWARTGAPDIAGWIRPTIADIVREPQSPPVGPPAPTSTPFALAIKRAPFNKVKAVAAGLDITVRELRQRARDDWQPEPWTKRQIAGVLGVDASELWQ
jgi:hypothetical protein